MGRSKAKRGFGIAVVVASVSTLLGLLGFHFYRVHLCDRLLRKIDQLASYPPSETTDLEWAVHIYWTHNLHCNSMPLTYASTDSLQEIDAELSEALSNQPGRLTIDRLWDSYSEMTDLGAECQRIYESEKNRIAAVVAEKGLEYEYIDDYRSFSGSRESQ